MIENTLLAAALAAADENSLISLSNKGLYKRACKDVEGVSAGYSEKDGGISIAVGGEDCLIKAPLAESRCSCPARGVCRHILGGILILRREIFDGAAPAGPPREEQKTEVPPAPELTPEPEAETAKGKHTLSADDAKEVRACCADGLGQLGGVLARGLVRSDASMADGLELAAVRAHAARMADAERQLRALSGRLTDCGARRASFDAAAFVRQLCRCAELLLRLSREGVTEEDLGTFRKTYEPYEGNLELLPIGQREVSGGEYLGNIYYFLNTDRRAKERFLTYSDLRPAFYENSPKRRIGSPPVWGLGVPLKKVMHERLVLAGAKLSGSQLSGSNDTVVLSRKKAVLDCPELRDMLVTDLREIVFALNEEDEGEKLFLIHPSALVRYGFDKYTQVFTMTIRDKLGRCMDAEIKYRAETKQLVAKLEEVCKKLIDRPEDWSMLASARLEGGRAVLYPIEVYDFLWREGDHRFTLPSEATVTEQDAAHAEKLLKLITELEDRLIHTVRSGLTSAQEGHEALLEQLGRRGLEKLRALSEDYFKAADSYRHSTAANGEEALVRMSAVMRYIKIAKQRLGLISAINKMNTEG